MELDAEWVSFKDELPPKYKAFKMRYKNKSEFEATRVSDKYIRDNYDETVKISDFTHWLKQND